MGTDGRRIVGCFKAVILGLCVFSSSNVLVAQDAANDEFAQWQSSMQDEFIDYVAQEQKEYAAYKAEVEKQWQTFVGSTKKDWVEYSEDKSSRSIVDFEKGEITLEVVIPVDEDEEVVTKKEADEAQKAELLNAQKAAAEKKKRERLLQAARERIKKRLQDMLANKSVNGESPVEGQVEGLGGRALSEKNVDQFVKKKVEKKLEVETKPYVAKDGKKRVKAKVKVKMVPEHLQVRANKYKKPVEMFAKKYKVEPALVYAVIHTESYFNPKARSHIPAYGLMQLVPSSGGLDAFRYAKGKDKKPSPNYLYQPENNIELGVAYLALVGGREFRKVEDDLTRKYLVVAAYNTGAGNVSRAFEGRRKLRATVDRVNRMTPDDVYHKLVRDLPYEETRNYIQKVMKREAIYQGF